MKKLVLFLFIATSFNVAVHSQNYNYDVNGDGVITSADVTAIYDYLLGNSPSIDETVYTVYGVTFKMIKVEHGTVAADNENPQEITLTYDYYIGETEVTQALWIAVMGTNPSYYNNGNYGHDLNRPVERVSWNDCQTFINNLNAITGKTFRLLTDAEWEYAARGGNLSHGYMYAGSNSVDDVAWYSGNSSSQTHTVASKTSNELGLFDMSGNVQEWVQNGSGDYRYLRGGGYSSSAESCIISRSTFMLKTDYVKYVGLRIAL